MKNKILFSIILLFLSVACFSQNIDSIINSKPKTEKELINIARELLLQEVLLDNHDSSNVRNIVRFQDYINNRSRLGLSQGENLLIYFYIQNWEEAIKQIIIFNHVFIHGTPPTAVRRLSRIVFEKIVERNKFELQDANLSQEQKDFLTLHYDCWTLDIKKEDYETFDKKYKALIETFEKKYRKSSYSQYMQMTHYIFW
jgi:hypothetical protein